MSSFTPPPSASSGGQSFTPDGERRLGVMQARTDKLMIISLIYRTKVKGDNFNGNFSRTLRARREKNHAL
jgi:hypothetical protein